MDQDNGSGEDDKIGRTLFNENNWILTQFLLLIIIYLNENNSALAQMIGSWIVDRPSPPSAAYMRQWTGSAFVQVMACRLFGAKPLSEPMLAICQLDSWKHISVKFKSEFYHFHSRKCVWKYHLRNGGHFVSASLGLGIRDYPLVYSIYALGSIIIFSKGTCIDGAMYTQLGTSKAISIGIHTNQRLAQRFRASGVWERK